MQSYRPVCSCFRLLGDARCCKDESADSWNATCEINWLKGWAGWQMRFTHFVQLGLEPNESPLWYLLGRRAAGSFACSHRCGADLLIPIFRRKSNGGVNTEHEKVSLMLIRVQNWSSTDRDFLISATKQLCPSFVFQDRTKKSENSSLNPLSEKAVSDVVRININVQDEDNNTHRFIYATPSKDNILLSFEGVA
ncbi:hypothetical protein JG688_00007986 [Phytophthora aleatoria]|uniref:Uncharacterized protein n=1 Tax=Phytophthora aleatoria TaxID=2496075 RepID=A0A8J5IIQ9_9STRA|nr:hypothetical protein JG688_00007986 [Phytophthora aleatoria]